MQCNSRSSISSVPLSEEITTLLYKHGATKFYIIILGHSTTAYLCTLASSLFSVVPPQNFVCCAFWCISVDIMPTNYSSNYGGQIDRVLFACCAGRRRRVLNAQLGRLVQKTWRSKI